MEFIQTPKGKLFKSPCPTCGTIRLLDKRRVGKVCAACFGKNQGTHNESTTRLYRIWSGAKQRASNPNLETAKWYSGKGVTMDKSWFNDYAVFAEWAKSNGYSDDLELDRKDTDGDYTPGNCRWITHQVNSQNRSNARCTVEKARKFKEAFARCKNVTQAAKEAGIPYMSGWHISKGNTWLNA